jgi:anti-sigma-K factor RskA/putative zinc finger protein
MTDHTTFKDEVGAYLLGALTDAERSAFEEHLATCPECRHELQRLRPAAELLPRSVEQVEPPSSLKASLMEVVEREAAEAGTAEPAQRRQRRSLGERVRELVRPMRPLVVASVLAVGVLAGFAVAQLGGGNDTRTLQASVNAQVLPHASGRLNVETDGQAILEVRGMPSPGAGRVYQAWVQRDGMIEPMPTFEVGTDGAGAVAVPEDVSGAQAVMLTREPRGGSSAPSEKPILTVTL